VAIAFAQEGDPRNYDTDAGILIFEANMAPTAQPACAAAPSYDRGIQAHEFRALPRGI
jgi:hypothetical protein